MVNFDTLIIIIEDNGSTSNHIGKTTEDTVVLLRGYCCTQIFIQAEIQVSNTMN